MIFFISSSNKCAIICILAVLAVVAGRSEGLRCWSHGEGKCEWDQDENLNPSQADIEERCKLRECDGKCTRDLVQMSKGTEVNLGCTRGEGFQQVGCRNTEDGYLCVCDDEDGCNAAHMALVASATMKMAATPHIGLLLLLGLFFVVDFIL